MPTQEAKAHRVGEWASLRNTSPEIAEAIFEVAHYDEKLAEKIWEEGSDEVLIKAFEKTDKDSLSWGGIHTDRQWKVLSKLKNGYQDSLFTSPTVARNVAAPLVKYIDKVLVADRVSAPKVTVLVGHDSNIASLLTALDFKPYQLHDQYERTPIGGQLVFQRWHDGNANRDLMKIEYVYQSARQLRNAEALTLKSPAQRVTLELKGCPVDANGFCPLDKFDNVMNTAAK